MVTVEAFMAGIRWVESRGDYAAVNEDSGAFGAYQMLPGNIDYFKERAGVVGDITDPDVQDAVARWWFLHLHGVYDGNWMLVAVAWHMGAGAVGREILTPLGFVYDGAMWPGADSVTLEQIEAGRAGESIYVAGVMEVAMAAFPKWHPDAIDVTGPVPVNGKPWYGGSGKRKLVLHTIEAADPWTIGWPRDWTRVRSAPHFYLNGADKNTGGWGTNRWPDKDWLYQTLPLDVAGYALRSNATEDDKYVWQVEIAGRAANTPDYPDPFYQAIAELCDWFVAECGVDDVVFNIQTGGRISQSALDKFSGIIGHRNVGKGVDTHTDPGRYFDQDRLRRFMGTTPPPEPPPPDEEDDVPLYSMYHGDGFDTGTRPGSDVPSKTKRSDVINFQLKLADLGFSPGTIDGKYGDATAAALKAFLGSGAVNDGRQFTGRNGYELDKAFAALQGGGDPVEHSHAQYALDGHTHPGLARVTHTHPIPSSNTLGADQP